ncbi:MAG: PQQ-binding-like beta-propeller repeat protein, partial [Patescibacteria group bacterium]
MPAKISLGLLFLPFFFLVSSSPLFAETSYHTFLSDFQRTGFYYAEGPTVPELNFRLKIMENNTFPFPYGVVTDDNGNIYVPARYSLFKYSSSGAKIWEYAVEPQSSWAMFVPLIYGDRIYFIASYATHHLFCLDLDGNLIWKQDLKIGVEPSLSFMASPIIVGEAVYVQSSSSSFSVRAYNKDTGNFLGLRFFTGFSGPYLNAGGVLASQNLIISTITGEISGINLKRVFNENINSVFGAHTLYLYRNTFQQGFNTNRLTLPSLDLDHNSRTYILVNNAENGKEAKLLALNEVLQKDWGVLIEGTTQGNIVVDKSGNIYFELKNVLPKTGNTIYSYTKDGKQRWGYEYEGYDSFPNIIIDANGILYAVSGEKVFALSSSDGFLLWEYVLDSYSTVTPVLDNFGNLLVVDFRGNLYSFKGNGEYAGCQRRFYCNGN